MPDNRKRAATTLQLEKQLWESGSVAVVGVDEVGRGAWAGPLTVAAVVVDSSWFGNPTERIPDIRDSKTCTFDEREKLHDYIMSRAKAVCVAHSSVDECIELGIADAQRLAAKRVLNGLGQPVEHVLVDGPWDFVGPENPGKPAASSGEVPHPQQPNVTTIVEGDRKSLSIAAASVVAKVTRDRIMIATAADYPVYWFASNKGYPCPRHIAALAKWGPSTFHRRNWAFVDNLRWTGISRLISQESAGNDTANNDDNTLLPVA